MTNKTSLTPHEHRLAWLVLALCLIGLIGHFAFPLTPDSVKALVTSLGMHAHMGSNHFVDTRMWLGIPNAGDVLSNLSFAIFGVWGLIKLRKIHAPSQRFLNRENFVLTLFFVGLIFTTIGSALYHLAPSDASLLWDRAGMAFAFAGMLGVAASERVSTRSGIWLGLVALLAGAFSLLTWSHTTDVLPWMTLQFGGMALILILAITRAIPNSLGVSLVWVVVFYGAAKVLEGLDTAVFEATGHLVSGHTLKHLVASLAALPIIRALQ
jgi:hypothetical protein